MTGLRFPLKKGLVAMAASVFLALGGVGALSARATDLPPGVLNYLREKDPKVKVRFDGLVMFSNGESYVPVIPQDPDLHPDSQRVIAVLPEGAVYPDLIQFDNNFFLMKLILTSSGRLTFPKMAEYPMQLREGLLPQDFLIPGNLFIPVELKILLGSLPYNPSYVPEKKPVIVPPSVTLSQQSGQSAPLTVGNRLTYVFDLNNQKIVSIEPLTGKTTGEVALEAVPAGLKVSPDGKLLFLPCLSTNELVVVDTGSNLVKTRVPVGQRPDSVLYVSGMNEVIVSNRYSPFLSVVDGEKLQAGVKINLPGNGGVMTLIPGETKLLVADSGKPQLYLVDLKTRAVEKTIPALPDISVLRAFKNTAGELEIWVASRSQDEVSVLNLSGAVLKTLTVGKKPVDMITNQNKLFILSAGDARFDVVDLTNRTLQPAIPLLSDTFPASVVNAPSEQRAYVVTAGSTDLIVVNLASEQVEKTVLVKFRGGFIAMTPDAAEKEPVIPVIETTASQVPQGPVKVKSTTPVVPVQSAAGQGNSGRVSRKFSIIKFGQETGEKKNTSRKNSGLDGAGKPGSAATSVDADNGDLPVKAGARLEQPNVLPAAADLPAEATGGGKASGNPLLPLDDKRK